MNINEFEKQLSDLKIKQPSKEYVLKTKRLLLENQQTQRSMSWSYIFAFCLIASMSLNFYFISIVKNQPPQQIQIVEHSNAQNSVGKYSIEKGAMIEHGPYNDIIIIMETKL